MQGIISQLRQATGAIPGTTTSELVELILLDGIRKQATDIHISPTDDVTNIFPD
jgi:type II secretory ATPase GspE/PulE/Tfp pilus assembly ATPase PilB-like protein